MKTKCFFLLICVAALSVNGAVASAAMHSSRMMIRPAAARPAPRFTSGATMGRHRFVNDRFRRFHRSHNRTFIFIDAFGFPFFYPYPYPYYGYYPYDYYGSNGYGEDGRSTADRVRRVQRELARAGYYHGPIDGILGPQTRRAIQAYERDHNMPG
jgi:hypothetical protein